MLLDYYFEGTHRKWNNEYNPYTTGTPWDTQFDELTYYIVPETYTFLPTFTQSFKQISQVVPVDGDFWKKSLVERKADLPKSAWWSACRWRFCPATCCAARGST